ncbi:MAG: hypothetical protein WC498_03525 [Candidatus Saccharimonadales bacterium]
MQTYAPFTYFGQAYGACAYGSGSYQQNGTCGTTTTPGNGSSLTNTGIAVAAIVTVACVILLVAIVVRIWKRPNKK